MVLSSERLDQPSSPAPRCGKYATTHSGTARSLPRPIPMADLHQTSTCQRNAATRRSGASQDADPLLIHVPGVAYEAHISRQVLLMETAASLGLSIHSHGTMTEANSEFRAWIEIDVPPEKDQSQVVPTMFYGDIERSTYHAMDSAAASVLAHLMTERKVQINDANYDQFRMLRRQLQAATSFENISKKDGQVGERYIAALRECNHDLLNQLHKICDENDGFLPLRVSTHTVPHSGTECTIVEYTGSNPPTTPHEKLARSLAQLASMKVVAGL